MTPAPRVTSVVGAKSVFTVEVSGETLMLHPDVSPTIALIAGVADGTIHLTTIEGQGEHPRISQT